ncbi:hypothetical protein E0J30_22925 [Escherichia coli]|nr:hypothetical protein AM408_00410 [Escherichia coli]TLC30560.1 hypothetical protein E2F00_23225 [Salmonella enterica subsp. enterica serovar Typhi]AUV23994.1 hypothetical protein C2U45_25275 [Escherichia coli]MBW5357968.1 hypothetical protein [Escherichia coli]MCE4157386.1 hypothetical protein [Escherichia coli]
MGSCAAPSAKGDDKFITTDYLQQCRKNRVFTCSFKDRCGTRGIIFNELVISTELRSACPAKHSFRAFCDICNTILVFA